MNITDTLIYREIIRQALAAHKGTPEEIAATINGVCAYIEKDLDSLLTAHQAATLANNNEETIRLSFTILSRLYIFNYAVTALSARIVRTMIRPEMLLAGLECLAENCGHAIQTGLNLQVDQPVPSPTHPAPERFQ